MRILHVVSSLDAAGVPNVLMAYLRAAPAGAFHVDFIVHGEKVGFHEAEVLERGSRVFHVTPRKTSFLTNIRQMKDIVSYGEYDVVHSHLNFSSIFPLLVARRFSVPVRIAHAHGSFDPRGIAGRIWHSVASFAIKRLATHYFSCSELSGSWLFGSAWRTGPGDSYLMRNAIDVDGLLTTFVSASEELWNAEDGALRLIAVGRLSPEKNHLFLLEVACELKKQGTAFRLVIAGEGPSRNEIQSRIGALGLSEEVELLGNRRDVGLWLGAADVCLMPSVREGLGLALIEAQALGTPCVASVGVPSEVDLTGRVTFVPLVVEAWLEAIRAAHRAGRGSGAGVEENGYDIRSAAAEYWEYMRMLAEPEGRVH